MQQSNYRLLIEKIDAFIRRYYLNKLLRGLIIWAAVLFSGYFIAALSEYFGHFNSVTRTVIFYFFILINVLIVVALVMPPLLLWQKLGRTIGHEQAAEIIGRHFAEIKDKLLNTLQLNTLAGHDEHHKHLIEASINQKIDTLRPVRFPSAVNLRANRKYLKWVFIPVSIVVIVAIAAPTILSESTKRLVKHDQYFAPPLPFNFNIENKSLAVTQGNDLDLNVRLTGNEFPSDIYIESDGHVFKTEKISISRFKYHFSNLQQTTSFKLSGGGYTSLKYNIRVTARPSLLRLDAHLAYPAYLHKKNETLANAGELTVPAGTTVSWRIVTQNADAVLFTLNNEQKKLITSDKGTFIYSARMLKPSAYVIAPINGSAISDSSAYHINIIADEAPAIAVEEKQDSVSIKSLYFTGKIQDDHGFSSLKFHYKVQTQDGRQSSFSQLVKADLSGTSSSFFYYWNIAAIKAAPGDRVSYFFEVTDNDGVSGPKATRTPERELSIPSEKQLAAQLNAGSQQVKQKMASAAKMASQIERESQRLNQILLNKRDLTFDEKKQVQDLMDKKKELDALVKEAQAENKKNVYNRQQNQQQTEQVTKMQNELDKLMDNLLDEKTQQMLQRLQEMLQQEQKESTRRELTKMQSDNKSLKKELDRMLELYKKLEFEQRLNEQVSRLNELSQQQQKLAEQTADQKVESKTMQQKQEQLKKDFEGVKKSLDDLQKSTADDQQNKFDSPKADEQKIDQQMDDAGIQISKNNSKKASESQKQAAQSLEQLGRKLQKDNEEKEGEELNIDARQLRGLLKDLVNSSFAQEKLMQTFKSTNASNPDYVNLTQHQKNIKDNLKTTEDSLYALSKRVPQIQSTVNTEITSVNDRITKALEKLGDRRTPEAVSDQQYAMTAMNNLALMLDEVLDQLQNSMKNAKSGKGKSKQSMQQLSQMQQKLNNNMQQMREQMQWQALQGQGQNQAKGQHQSQSEQFARMAREQQAIRQALQQYNRDALKDGKGNPGDLDKIAKQMEQTETDLVNRRITDDAIKRQEQIKSRLLEAEKAEQEREQDKQRLSKAGKNIPPGYIKALQQYEEKRTKQTELIRSVSPELNFYYKQKAKKYFEQINGK
ncbi:DUF4175 family protein [Mucilaginibacter ginkgonis]|uniref:Uncharacterized protein n=1 Tax=Mucilaginibacter ginkgonis TaxID=2682091 RepID=A0A6I4I2C6_9SPHI|nr:DUF4175 family protein [Mucilaginibacter ginkgonis]QQL49373.1 hypothetical protein GO620_014540 [Mucilaginibacter ginkgonis]